MPTWRRYGAYMSAEQDEVTAPDQDPGQAEQLVQQQTGTPVRLTFVTECMQFTNQGTRLHVLAIDDQGALWERWEFEPDGTWHEIQRPTR